MAGTLTPHLTVERATDYIEFLKRVFDAVELTRSSSPDGRLLNASVRIAASIYWMQCCVDKASRGWLRSRIAITRPVLGRPLFSFPIPNDVDSC